MNELIIPDSLLLGSATAATQIEGSDEYNNWHHWAQSGKIKGDVYNITACDHYNRYQEDIEIMQQMNIQIYRMSIEWSRIEPVEGLWSKKGINHYIHEIQLLLKANIKPLITLHHFSHPQWFEEKGAWTNKKSVYYFCRFVNKIVKSLGHLVNEYCTINEPNVFANDTYIDGKYPPGKMNDTTSYFICSRNLIKAHLKSYRLIHKVRASMGFDDTRVGFAIHIAHMECASKNPLTKLSKSMMDFSFHTMFLKGMIEGKLVFPLGHSYPEGKGVFCDYLGINYYSRHLIHSSPNPFTLFGEVKVDDNISEDKLNDLGWEIYPSGLSLVIEKIYSKYKLPIFITENGIADSQDTKRSKFIYDHLSELVSLINTGIDIQRYYHWSLLDNLEWNDGYGPRFGLVEVDYTSLERKIRNSGRFYSEICKHRILSDDIINEYII